MNRLVVDADLGRTVIDKNIYGHFSEHLGRCIYEGYWVGEGAAIPNTRGIRGDVVAALRKLNPPVLRWPGGCFADEYHWQDGIGPREARPSIVNTHWGGVTENNHFGTHEFMDLCEQLGADPYICGNVGSGSVREMQQWVEYITFDGRSPMADRRRQNGREQPWRLPYFGVGNENWGCGGHMRPEYYADLYRQFQTYVRNFGGNKVYKIACGPNVADYRWTETLMREAGRFMHGLSLHYYTHAERRDGKSSATEFDEGQWFSTLKAARRMDELITRHSAIMDQYDPERRIGLVVDEWGTWYDVEPGTNPGFLYQQNTMRDALVAAIHFDIFHKHAERVRMANIAQTVNVLQAMILTDGPRLLLTPTYHVFELYKVHQGGVRLPLHLEGPEYAFGAQAIPALSATASRAADGTVHLSLSNADPSREQAVTCDLRGARFASIAGRILATERMNAHNTFDAPETVAPRPFEDFRIETGRLDVTLPPMAIAVLTLHPGR
ncbi:MAG TPA: alpha-N-arabinofuranosidase [Limnochordia bacterium]|nr:alpha-N-arabinofuranosidase [Limnochordia bacterium]